jgi:hypothetical protein
VRVTVYPARGQVDRRSAQSLGLVSALPGWAASVIAQAVWRGLG